MLLFHLCCCEHVSAWLQWRKRSPSHPHTATSVAQGTHMSGRSRRPQGYVYFETASQTQMYSQPFICGYILSLYTQPLYFHSLLVLRIILLFSFSVCPQMRTNVPSWCDRILWKSYPETHIVCNSYGELNHSTHVWFQFGFDQLYMSTTSFSTSGLYTKLSGSETTNRKYIFIKILLQYRTQYLDCLALPLTSLKSC